MENNQVNKEVIETGRIAWNKVSNLFDTEPQTFKDTPNDREAFAVFYKTLVTTLFEEEKSE